MRLVGHVQSLHRYPVKSMVGEDVRSVNVTSSGLEGDRAWAVRNLEAREQQGARRLPGLLGVVSMSQTPGDPSSSGPPLLRFPDGETLVADDPRASERLSEHLGKRVKLVPLAPRSNLAHYRLGRLSADGAELRREFGMLAGEDAPDMSNIPFRKLAQLSVFATPPGTYFDAFPLHLITTSSLRYVRSQSGNANIDARRYRPNVVIDSGDSEGLIEAGWEGARLELGGCEIHVEARTIRCSIPGRAQAIEGIGADKDVIRAVAQHADRHLGVYATVIRGGSVSRGDPVHLFPRAERPVADRLRQMQRGVIRRIFGHLLRDPEA